MVSVRLEFATLRCKFCVLANSAWMARAASISSILLERSSSDCLWEHRSSSSWLDCREMIFWRLATCSLRVDISAAFSFALLELDWIREVSIIILESRVSLKEDLRFWFSSLKFLRRSSLPSLMRSCISSFSERLSGLLSSTTWSSLGFFVFRTSFGVTCSGVLRGSVSGGGDSISVSLLVMIFGVTGSGSGVLGGSVSGGGDSVSVSLLAMIFGGASVASSGSLGVLFFC